MSVKVYTGDALTWLGRMPDGVFDCSVTSPPYWGLRDYKHPGQLGHEKTPELYVARLVEILREVRRVLRDDGTLWLVMGDSYCTSPRGNRPGDVSTSSLTNPTRQDRVPRKDATKQGTNLGSNFAGPNRLTRYGLKSKDLVGIPWMTAFALRADGWYLRTEVIWAKAHEFCPGGVGSTMPESVRDRPTRAHEYVFLLTKSARYYYDAKALAQDSRGITYEEVNAGYDGQGLKAYADAGVQNPSDLKRRIIAGMRKRADPFGGTKHTGTTTKHSDGSVYRQGLTRNLRDVWFLSPRPYKEAHFATYPPALVEPCLRAGSRPGGWILDPFAGSGTTGAVATALGRHAALIELNPEYVRLIRGRVAEAEATPERYLRTPPAARAVAAVVAEPPATRPAPPPAPDPRRDPSEAALAGAVRPTALVLTTPPRPLAASPCPATPDP